MIESAEEFVRLRSSSDPEDYRRAAHEEAPLHVWLEVIERYPRMRSWVAHNKAVPMEVLQVLAVDPEPEVRAAVADKRKLSIDLFHSLAIDEDEGVRARLAYNRKLPIELLEALAGDPSDHVRKAAQTALTLRSRDR